MNDQTNEAIRAEVLAELEHELQTAAPSVNWGPLLLQHQAAPGHETGADLLDQVLTVRRTLEAAIAVLMAGDRRTLTVTKPAHLALVRDLQGTADHLLDLSLDLAVAGGLTFTVNPIDETEISWRDES